MSALQIVSICLGIGATIGGAIIALVKLGFKVGTISHRIDSLEVSNKEWNVNNREKINEMTESNNTQNTSIKLLEQKLDGLRGDIQDMKALLGDISIHMQKAETDRAKIESRLDYLERQKNGK